MPESFVASANEFDRMILANGWPGVKVGDKPDFETAWQNLMALLERVEQSR